MFFDKVSGWKLFLAGFTVAENPFLVFMFVRVSSSTASALNFQAYPLVPLVLFILREFERLKDVVACGAQHSGVLALGQTVVVHALPAQEILASCDWFPDL